MRTIQTIIGIGWVVFWLYWIIAAFKSKSSTIPSDVKRFVGIRVSVIPLALVFVIIYRFMPKSFRDHAWASNNPLLYVGLLLFLAGIVLAFWARITMGEDWGMPMTVKQKPGLVTSGPFRYIRHPIYSGLILMALGSSFVENSYWIVVTLVALFYFTYSAFSEEKMLAEQLPKAYPAYVSRTKRLIPFVF